jgi:hypothetical protein
MSALSAPTPVTRHALGMPAGSVRALHTLMIVGLVCAFLLMPNRQPIPPYLQYLLFLSVAHFYAAHGNSIARGGQGRPSPLHLPAGSLRLIIFLGLVATIIYRLVTDSAGLAEQLTKSVDRLKEEPLMPVIILAGFFLGVLFRWVTGGVKAYWVQNVQAWFSLVSALLLGVAALIHLVIDPSLKVPLELPNWEGFLAAVVAFYFGERS